MTKNLKVLMCFIALCYLGALAEGERSILCKFEKVGIVKYKNKDKMGRGGELISEAAGDNMTVTFGDLDSDNPILVGNAGTEKLKKFESDDNHIYLIEATKSGNIVIWTYFPQVKIMIYSKQYTLGTPFGMMGIGKCESM